MRTGTPLQGMGEDISWATHPPRLIYEYLVDGERGLSRLERRLRRRAESQPGGKFSKEAVSYLPFRPFPLVLWDNVCGRCRFWHEGGPGEPGGCHIVGREGDGGGGEAIHPRGWCGLYTPPKREPSFAWIRDRISPSGDTDVRGKYEPETTRKRKARRAEQRRRKREAVRSMEPSDAGSERGAPTTGDDHE